MKYSLYLDDYRMPESTMYKLPDVLLIARSMDDAIWTIEKYGIPEHMYFDHDLAEEHYIIGDGDKTGFDVAMWLVDKFIDNNLGWPEGFTYSVHSMNPVGKEKIIGYLENYRKSVN